MKWLQQLFSDTGGYASSKRALGALCLVYAMSIGLLVFLITRDISGNILAFLMAMAGAGTTLLGISIFEKK